MFYVHNIKIQAKIISFHTKTRIIFYARGLCPPCNPPPRSLRFTRRSQAKNETPHNCLFLYRDFCVPKKSRPPLVEILCPPLSPQGWNIFRSVSTRLNNLQVCFCKVGKSLGLFLQGWNIFRSVSTRLENLQVCFCKVGKSLGLFLQGWKIFRSVSTRLEHLQVCFYKVGTSLGLFLRG